MSTRDDDFDLVGPRGGAGRRAEDDAYHDELMFDAPPGPPQMLMRPRGQGTGSIFHETGIWPPPGAGSRLQDPLLSASEVELGGIVDDVMGSPRSSGVGAHRLRGGSDSMSMENPFADEYEPRATSPAYDSPLSAGHARNSSATGSSSVHAPLLGAPHPRFSSIGSGRGSRLALVTPETAGPSAKAYEAGSSSHHGLSPSAHGHAVGTLVDLSPGQEAEMRMPAELPPQYHTIRRDTQTSARSAESVYSDARDGGEDR